MEKFLKPETKNITRWNSEGKYWVKEGSTYRFVHCPYRCIYPTSCTVLSHFDHKRYVYVYKEIEEYISDDIEKNGSEMLGEIESYYKKLRELYGQQKADWQRKFDEINKYMDNSPRVECPRIFTIFIKNDETYVQLATWFHNEYGRYLTSCLIHYDDCGSLVEKIVFTLRLWINKYGDSYPLTKHWSYIQKEIDEFHVSEDEPNWHEKKINKYFKDGFGNYKELKWLWSDGVHAPWLVLALLQGIEDYRNMHEKKMLFVCLIELRRKYSDSLFD